MIRYLVGSWDLETNSPKQNASIQNLWQYIYCSSFFKSSHGANFLTDECCLSCHEDNSEYGFDLLEFELPNYIIISVCCRVSKKISDMLEAYK